MKKFWIILLLQACNIQANLEEPYLKKIIAQFHRPVTILFIGATPNDLQLSQDLPYGCLVVSNNIATTRKKLFYICKKNNYNNLILLEKQITIPDLIRLSECEHFDIIVALKPIEQFGNEWKKAISYISNLGAISLISLPQNIDKKHLPRFDKSFLPIQLDVYEQIMITHKSEHNLLRPMWFRDPITKKGAYPYKKGPYLIVSDYQKKLLYKTVNYPIKKIEKVPWKPGINLMTFKMLKGTYPETKQVKQSIQNLRSIKSNDWMPNNMIIQGKKIVLIDTNEPIHEPGHPGGTVRHYTRYKRILNLMEIQDPARIESVFWEHVIRGKPFKKN